MIASLAILAALCPLFHGQTEEEAVAKYDLVIGVPYHNTPTGGRHLKGVQQAVDHHELKTRLDIHIQPIPYLDDPGGVEAVRTEISREEGLRCDLLLGPTDSGVFVPVYEQQTELGTRNIPIISSLVTADVKNSPDGWLFRTNVGIARRSSAVFDFLNKRWVNSIAVLYADSEFGRGSEEAFRSELLGIQRDSYISLPFQAYSIRADIRKVLNDRPAAVGVFGTREDILRVYRELGDMNESGTPYEPILFTNIDVRSLRDEIDNFYFVSVLTPDSPLLHVLETEAEDDEPWDDVRALSYDTTCVVLDEIASMSFERGETFDKTVFRQRLSNSLGGALQRAGPATGMRFAGMENNGAVHVYRIDGKDVVPILPETFTWTQKVQHKLSMLAARFGLWPFGVIAAILLTVLATSVHDIYRWYGGGMTKLILTTPRSSLNFLALVVLQGSVAVFLFAWLSETGRMRYDSVVNGLLVGLAPSPLLRMNFARFGQTNIGLGDQYDRLLQVLTRRLLTAKYHDPETNVLIVAYYNSLGFLWKEVNAIYARAGNQEEAQRMRADLEQQVNAETAHIGKRKLLARMLVELRSWDELKRLGCVPEDMPENPRENPEKVISDGVRYCLGNDERTARLEAITKRNIRNSGDMVRKHYQAKVDDAKTKAGLDVRDELYINFQFLFMRFGYDRRKLELEQLLPPSKSGLIEDTVKACLENSQIESQVQKIVEQHTSRNSSAKKQLATLLKGERKARGKQRARIYAAVKFLVDHLSYDRDRLIKEGLLNSAPKRSENSSVPKPKSSGGESAELAKDVPRATATTDAASTAGDVKRDSDAKNQTVPGDPAGRGKANKG